MLTVVAVLWHAIAGCCAHHDHVAATADAASCGCHAHACGEEASTDSHGSDRAKPAEESDDRAHLASPHDSSVHGCGDRCSFAQPEGSGVSLLKHSLAACDLALPVATLVEFRNVAPEEPSLGFDAPPPPHVGHALRRHLALGVLLV